MECVLLFLSSPFALKNYVDIYLFIYFWEKNIYLIQVHLIEYRLMDVYNYITHARFGSSTKEFQSDLEPK